MEDSVKQEIEQLIESIEGHVKNWDTHDSLADFEEFTFSHDKLCRLIGMEPKKLSDLAYPNI